MTRFARAKGSKASNEKAPEDGTPWEVMKEQLLKAKHESEDAAKRQDAEKQRIENYEKFLKERKTEKRPATWCDFPETDNVNQSKQPPKKKKKKNKQLLDTPSDDTSKADECKEIKKKKKKDKFENVISPQTSSKVNGVEQTTEISKKKNKKLQPEDTKCQETDSTKAEQFPKKKNKKNKKHKQTQDAGEASSSNNDINNHSDTAVLADINNQKESKKQFKKIKSISQSTSNEGFEVNAHSVTENKKNSDNQPKVKAPKKKKKLVDGKPVRRKEINDNSFQIIIHGKEVELVRFDGFPVMKKDAERLAELKNSMIKKGIPKSEVQRTMKLERRRAEKALARVRREVCYNCRKGGHNLSDCPELKSKIPGADVAEGVCFKCGSTEHRQFECKVQRDKEFRFATCFICKEPGHIARQCPDNPKGLYPNGGCCKLCGDVTHLRKDCPTANTKKEETSVKLQTLDSTDNLENIEIQNKIVVQEESSKKPKKIRF